MLPRGPATKLLRSPCCTFEIDEGALWLLSHTSRTVQLGVARL